MTPNPAGDHFLNPPPRRNDHQEWRVEVHRGKLRGEAMIDNRTQVVDVAMKKARTIEAFLDRLAKMGADRELKMKTGPLSRLTAPFFKSRGDGAAREQKCVRQRAGAVGGILATIILDRRGVALSNDCAGLR